MNLDCVATLHFFRHYEPLGAPTVPGEKQPEVPEGFIPLRKQNDPLIPTYVKWVGDSDCIHVAFEVFVDYPDFIESLPWELEQIEIDYQTHTKIFRRKA
jgi:hypothetical protein